MADRRQLIAQIFIYALFALSLDLILGYAGILSLGHAAFFGVGAYTAGLLARHGWPEPLSGLGASAVVAGVFGYAASFLVVPGADLTRLMITLGIGLLASEAANQASSLTGGVDGLSDMADATLLGKFSFGLDGTTAFIYGFVVLALLFLLARRVVHSPFGLGLRGIRENARRMPAIGADVNRRLRTIFTLGGGDGRRGRRVAGADDALRRYRRARLPALRRAAHHPRLRRDGAPLWCAARGRGVHAGAGCSRGAQPGVLAVLAGRDVGAAGARRPGGPDGRCRSDSREADAAASATTGVAMACALKTEGLRRSFRGFVAVDGVSLEIAAGARHALIGPNGAGKTTLINLLTGVLRPDAGDVMLGAERITELPPHARVKRGLARTFQLNTLFAHLTVLESVVLAICERRGNGGDWWRPVAAQRGAVAEAQRLLRSLQLEDDAATVTRQLPYGKQRLLEIALALAAKPSVLLLDEPAAGIPSGESRQLFETIERLPAETTIVLIEHDMSLVFRFARRITVLAGGRVLTEGSPAEVAADSRVRELYLGDEAHV